MVIGLLVIVAAPGAAMAGWTLFVCASWYVISLPPGEVPYEEWPPYLRYEHAEWRKDGIEVDGMEVYATDAMFNDAAYCKLPYTPETWAYLKKRYGGPEDGSIEAEREHWSHVAADLPDWAPSVSDQTVEYAPFDDPNGDEGLSMRLACDPVRLIIYLDYYFNF